MSDNNLNSNSSKISSETKYQYKSGTILYEEDIHYNTMSYNNNNNNINAQKCNQESIKEILNNYKKNNIPRLYEEDIWV